MHSLELWIEHYGSWAFFILLYFEAFGAPLPGETALLAGSILAATGKLNIVTLLIAAFCGGVLGDCTGFAIGHFGGKKLLLRFGYLIRLTPERLDKFQKMLNEKGYYFVATARFIPFARQLNGIIAGAGGMNFSKFFLANATGAAAWTFAWGAVPYIVKTLL